MIIAANWQQVQMHKNYRNILEKMIFRVVLQIWALWADAVCRSWLIGEILSSPSANTYNVCVTWGPYNIYRRAEGTEHERAAASHPSTFISSHTQSVILAAVVCVCMRKLIIYGRYHLLPHYW